MRRFAIIVMFAAAVTACSRNDDDGIVDVALIGDAATLYAGDAELPPGAKLLREAQRQGLVRLNAAGDVVPGLAERWIVTDDGTSYIFRITEFDLAGGERLSARSVADALRMAVAQTQGTSLGFDLAKIRDIRAMTGRVIEVRLTSPMPGFLQLLAQPELGVSLRDGVAGPMAAEIVDGAATLTVIPPEQRGLSQQTNWDDALRDVRIEVLSASQAARAFEAGEADVLLGGRLETLPLAITGALSRGTVRLDSAIGLFGLDVRRPEGFLATAENREAIAMAIDRPALVEGFNLGGWNASTRIVTASLPGDDGTIGQRWQGQSLEQRRAVAAQRVRDFGQPVSLSLALPQGPGSDLLFEALAADLRAVGIELSRAQEVENADLTLRDRVARFAAARWYLNQFNCAVSRPVCSEDTDFLVQLSIAADSPAEEASYLSEAEQMLTLTNLYIPLGSPVRWSQVRAGVDGFAENVWAHHPLFPLSRAPM